MSPTTTPCYCPDERHSLVYIEGKGYLRCDRCRHAVALEIDGQHARSGLVSAADFRQPLARDGIARRLGRIAAWFLVGSLLGLIGCGALGLFR